MDSQQWLNSALILSVKEIGTGGAPGLDCNQQFGTRTVEREIGGRFCEVLLNKQ
jgi:hypothetical protein